MKPRTLSSTRSPRLSHSKIFFAASLATLLSAVACGSSGDSDAGGDGDGDGEGDGDGDLMGSGGSLGDGDGDLPGSGGTAGTGGNLGTGGSDANGSTPTPGTSLYDCGANEEPIPATTLSLVASGFTNLVLVTHAPDDAARLFAVEQGGVIKIVKGTTVNPTPFLDITAAVKNDDPAWTEQGLLGLAFHPDYATNGLFYVHYTAKDSHPDAANAGDTIIAEFQVSGDADVADGSPNGGHGRTVLTVDQPPDGPYPSGANHNGGSIAFGSDGLLYIALGDGGGGDDMYGNGQNLTTNMGAILRINPDGSAVTGNLPGGTPEMWDYGLRNPYRMTFDGCTGDLYIGDVGQSTWEEINVEPAGMGHRNYGWPIMEGPNCSGSSAACDAMVLPAATLKWADGYAIVGGAVYRGSSIPALRGTYFYGEYSTGNVFRGRYDSSSGQITGIDSLLDQAASLTSIQNGGDGELYVTTKTAIRKIVAQ